MAQGGPERRGGPAVAVLALALVVTLGLGSWWVASSLEGALTARAREALATGGLAATAVFDGADATVRADDAGVRDAAVALVASLPGVRVARAASPAPGGTPTPSARPTTPSPRPSATPSPSAPPRSLTLIVFAEGAATLSPQGELALLPVVEYLATYPDARVRIVGHPDGAGSGDAGLALGTRRAESAASWLAGQGFAGDRLQVSAADIDAAGRLGRRVEVLAG